MKTTILFVIFVLTLFVSNSDASIAQRFKESIPGSISFSGENHTNGYGISLQLHQANEIGSKKITPQLDLRNLYKIKRMKRNWRKL